MATSGDRGTGGGRQDQMLGPALTDRTLIASAESIWKVYVFLRRNGGNGLGHTAVGYQNNRGDFTCGGVGFYQAVELGGKPGHVQAKLFGQGDVCDGRSSHRTSTEAGFKAWRCSITVAMRSRAAVCLARIS